jgi:phosphate-selective porin OprO/OprP
MRKAVAVMLVAAAFYAQAAEAKTLEDVLKEKGVISEADYKEVMKSKPVTYKVGKGFTFLSDDEKFQLSLGGRLQARYTFFDRDPAQDQSQWQIRRMKIWMSGYAYTKDLTYLLQVDATQTSSTPSSGTGNAGAKFIDHAYMNYRLIDEFQVLVGQTKVPFGRQWLTSSGALSFVDRSPTSDAFRPGYDIGVKLHGKIAKGLVNYDLGGYGGKGQGIPSSNNDNSFAARIAVNPLGDLPYSEADLDTTAKPLFSVGTNYFYDRVQYTRGATAAASTFETTNLNFMSSNGWLTAGNAFNRGIQSEKVDVNLYGVDAAFKWMGVYAVAEYLLGQAEGDSSGALLRAQGYFLQAGYCVVPKTLEVAARWSYVDPDRDAANNLRTEVGGAVSYYINKHNLKIQGDVANLHTQRGTTAPTDEMQYRLQAQIIF